MKMKSKTIWIGSLLILTILASCQSNSTGLRDQNVENNNMSNKFNATPAEESGVRKALDAYIEAAIKGDSNIAKPVFGELATISFSDNDSLVSSPIQALYDYYDQTGPHNAEYEITSLEVAGNVAIVRIDSKFGEVSFDDMFALVKDGNNWKIVSKVYNVK